jgi:hypothetical protein
VRITNQEQWMVKFERAALEYVAERADVILDETCPLRLEPCEKHGTECLRLIVGVLLTHICWQSADPERAAVAWMHILLPRRVPAGPVPATPLPRTVRARCSVG